MVNKVGKILVSFRNYRRNARLLTVMLLLSFVFQLNLVLMNLIVNAQHALHAMPQAVTLRRKVEAGADVLMALPAEAFLRD